MKSSGFSLIELCVTIAIIGLVAGIGIVQYRQWSSNQQVVSRADQVANLFKRAAQVASTVGSAPLFAKGLGTEPVDPPQQIGVQITLLRDGKVVETMRAEGFKTRVEGFPNSGGFANLESGVALDFKQIRTDGNAPMMFVVFGANGMPLETGSITLYNSKVARVIRVLPGGMVKVNDTTPP